MSKSKYDARHDEKLFDREYIDNGGPTFKGELKRIRNDGWDMPGICYEAIDNSFEAGALRITITGYFSLTSTLNDAEMTKLEIVDDGCGINNLKKISRLGYEKAKRESIGCYGRGIKEATISKFLPNFFTPYSWKLFTFEGYLNLLTIL